MIVDSEGQSDSDDNDGVDVESDSESEAVELPPAIGDCALCTRRCTQHTGGGGILHGEFFARENFAPGLFRTAA